jgi:hypothetical protein
MRATIEGQVVKTGSEPWAMGDRTGIAHAYYVRDDSTPEASAQRVRCERADQLPKNGDRVRAVVDIFPQASDRGGAPRLRVSHVEYADAKPAHRLQATS